MKILAKSEVEIGVLIHCSLGVDLSVYVGSENLPICRLCYNMLNAYKALKKINQIVDGIKQKFKKIMDLSVSKDYRKIQQNRHKY